ncbi:MAG TPA: ATP phosphoribosyltransferase regulatory subunit [Pelomicrobium sp.]|nr:ATP phosphoribosyltransferase regulatory subunit [Pelomicrobium sp.]
MRNWLLPEHIQDLLPPAAARLERARRALLDLFRGYGYQLVMPPLIEYVESLLSGTGQDLELEMFKVVDQLSGRLMGVRADITPQAARIDAHLLNRRGVTRLCYAGSVLRTLPSSMTRTREPLQVGAEIYGHAGPESDIEIQRLMLAALACLGAPRVHLDLGHVGIYRALAREAGLSPRAESELFRALQTKDAPLIAELTAKLKNGVAFQRLPQLFGGGEVVEQARRSLPALPEIGRALDELEAIAGGLQPHVDELSFDLAELRGYHYHSGAVFAAYLPGSPAAMAQGGRYDEVGSAFGRARAATGFSLDLRDFAALLPDDQASLILAPAEEDPALAARVQELRAAGEVVIVDLPGHADNRDELGCDRELVRTENGWSVVSRRGDK